MAPMTRALLLAAVLAAATVPTVRAADTNLDAVGASAQKDLDVSLRRAGRAARDDRAERVPLSQELSRLEAELAALRRESERRHATRTPEASS